MRLGAVVLYRARSFPVMALFIAWAGVTVVWSPYKNAGVQWMVTMLCYGTFVLLVVQHVSTSRHVRRLVAVVLVMGLFQAIVGGIQFFALGEWRAKGTFFNPNFFASYEAVCLVLSFSILSHADRCHLLWWERFVLGSSIASAIAALIWAQSRGALLAGVVVITCIGCYRYRKMFVLVLVSCALVVSLVPNPLRDRIAQGSSHDPFAYTRLEMWKDALHRIHDHPFGVGIGMYKYGSFQYRFPLEQEIVRYGKRAESAHSGYLQVAVELGVVGLGLLLAGMVVWWQEAMQALRRVTTMKERGLIIGLIGGVAVLLIHAAVDSVFHEPALVLLLLLCGALVIVMRRMNEPETPASWNFPLSNRLGSQVLVYGWMFLMMVLTVQTAAGWAVFDRGEQASNGGNYARALEWFELAASIDPGRSAYHDAIGLVCLRSFLDTRSIEWIDKALEHETLSSKLNPLDPRFANRLGTIYLLIAAEPRAGPNRKIAIAKAAEFFEEARRLDPFSPFNYLELARIRREQGQTQDAHELLEDTLRREPNFLPGRILLVELFLHQGQTQAAQAELETIKAISARYAGRVLTVQERSFLDVDLQALDHLLAKDDV
jgi:O-antigen ligase